MIKKVIALIALIISIPLLLILFAPKDKRIDEYLVNINEYKEILNNRTQNNNITADIFLMVTS